LADTTLKTIASKMHNFPSYLTRVTTLPYTGCRWCSSSATPVCAERSSPLGLRSGARRHDHITPVLVSLHWLPVSQRII